MFSVLGLISPDELGVVLPHEHLLLDFRLALRDPEYDGYSSLTDLEFKLENLGKIRQYP